jgi:hypothetical protein
MQNQLKPIGHTWKSIGDGGDPQEINGHLMEINADPTIEPTIHGSTTSKANNNFQ